MAEVGSIIDNKYRIIDQVGKGGMSAVYLARDKRLEKLWAVKEILNVGDPRKRKTLVDSLKSEARLMKDLDHPAVVRIVDIIDEKSSLFVVMDYIDGRDLTSYLFPNGKKSPAEPIEEAQAVEWGIQICDVIRYLHSQNPPVIYYDLKPDNVMIRNEGDVRLIDFGAARKYSPDPKVMNKYKILGTVGYAAPEQYKGGAATDIRTDIYAFGVSLHFMVTGQPPQGNRKNKNPRLRPIREINPRLSSGLERIINKCTQPDPKDRYQNCDELIYALEHYHELDDQYKAKQKKTLKTFVITAAVSLGLLALGGIFALINSSNVASQVDKYLTTGYQTEEEHIENIKKAYEVDQSRTEAIEELLTVCETKGQITPDDASNINSMMNGDAVTNEGSSESVSRSDQLHYRVGRDFLFYSCTEGGTEIKGTSTYVYDLTTAVENAKTHFESAGNYENAEDLYNFCDLYEKNVVDGTSEPTAEEYGTLLGNMEEILSSMRNASSNNDEAKYLDYGKLSLYNGMCSTLNSLYDPMLRKGVAKDTLKGTVEKIKEAAAVVSVTKSAATELQSKVQTDCEKLIAAIESQSSVKSN